MKFATYNVWYENIGIRTQQLVDEINGIDADIIGLQEVPPSFFEKLTLTCKYTYNVFSSYDDEMGLAFLSKHPIGKQFSLFESAEVGNSVAHNIIIESDGFRISVTNVHLPWDSVLEKEKQIVAIDKYIHIQQNDADFFVLLGDFNCTLNSSAHHYLLGDQTLLGCESKPYWNDLALAHAALNGYEVRPTLDFVTNPRWRGENTNYIPNTCDRIYIMDSFNWDYEFELRDIKVFGTEISSKTGYAPSDHYGLLADVTFKA